MTTEALDTPVLSAANCMLSMAPLTTQLVSAFAIIFYFLTRFHVLKCGDGDNDQIAIEIFFEALEKGTYKCFLGPKTDLPMIYIDDTIKCTLDLMRCDNAKLTRRTYNVAGISFNPEQLAASLKKIITNFEITYEPDFRQKIADAWPKSIDDSNAKKDWGWSYDVSVDDLARKIFDGIAPEYKAHLNKK